MVTTWQAAILWCGRIAARDTVHFMRWLTKQAMELVMPSGGRLKGIGETDMDGFLDAWEADAPAAFRWGLVAGSALVMASPVLTIGVPLPANALSPRKRDEHIYKLSMHPVYMVRQVSFIVKMVAGLAWGQDPDIRRDCGVVAQGDDPGTWRGSF